MRFAAPASLPFIAAMLLTSCDRPAIEPGQSLVGAKHLPSARELSREIIEINRGLGTVTPGPLTYQLRPDDTLNITWYAPDWKTVRAAEKVRLSTELAAQTRRALWRLRPERLEGIEFEIQPSDCPPPPTDTSPESSVVFFAEPPKPGQAHIDAGLVVVPRASICSTKDATEVRNLLQDVLQSFPPSKLTAQFNQSPRKPILLP